MSNLLKTAFALLSCTLVTTACKPTAQTPRRNPAIAPTSPQTNTTVTPRPRIKPTQFQATPSPPNLILLGTWQTLAGTEFDAAFYGNNAKLVASASMSGRECVYQTQLSTQNLRLFRCIAPYLDDTTETRTEPLRVTYNDGALPTYAGPFVFRNASTWKQYNGDFFFQSVQQYVINASSASGPTIVLQARSLPGYVGDPTFSDYASYFNAIRLNGSGITVVCPSIGIYEYKCQVIPEGTYSFEILHDQGRRYVVDNTFTIKVTYGSIDPPAPEVGTVQAPQEPTTQPTPQCDPSAIKGC